MVAPQSDNAFMYYQFYRLFPAGSLLVQSALGLRSFTSEGVNEALGSSWKAFDFLRSYNVEQISWAGVPLSAFAGRARMLAILDEARGKADIPVTTDFEDLIAAMQHLGLKRPVIAAKWAPDVMDACARYLADAGIEVVGSHGEAHTPQQVHALNTDEGIAIGTDLGTRALRESPDADCLLLLGGAWLVMQSVVDLEAAFAKPVITNPTALFWAALRRGGIPGAVGGTGMLLGTAAMKGATPQ